MDGERLAQLGAYVYFEDLSLGRWPRVSNVDRVMPRLVEHQRGLTDRPPVDDHKSPGDGAYSQLWSLRTNRMRTRARRTAGEGSWGRD